MESIKNDCKLNKSNHFVYCKNGFESDFVFCRLQNVPLYDSENEELDFTPLKVSGFRTAYIKYDDFINWKQKRVEVLFNDEEFITDFKSMYVDFYDLHSIKIGNYVNDTLLLTNTKENTLKLVDKILDDQFNKFEKNEEFKKENLFALFKDNKIIKFLTYVSLAYSKHEIKTNAKFNMHKNQIFTALEASKIFLNKNNDNSGVIYQVETGEGKSCIICLITSLLALMKKTVHITSSNITLANRDYHESFDFFKMLGLKSAVLLHYNELPVNLSKQNIENENKNSMKNDNNSNENFSFNENFYPNEFFHKKLFNNSSNMNFSVCGINNDNEISDNKANIIFSMFVNFESLYLKLMEIYPSISNNFFHDCSLIIDEADSILIDELTNGTILSRSMKTNGSEVLKFIYSCYIENQEIEYVFSEVKKKFPKCEDLTIDDIKDMYSQIELINQEEFQNGKKYSIETKEIKEKLSLKSLIEKSKEFVDETKEKVKDGIKSIPKQLKKNDEMIEVIEKKSSHKKKNRKKSKTKNEKIISKNKFKRKIETFKEIVPFDYDHKGVLEPNKEFSGFIQQFIAIKEMLNNEENQNMIIKDVSMNYLYVSHPIFVKLYGGVVGLIQIVSLIKIPFFCLRLT